MRRLLLSITMASLPVTAFAAPTSYVCDTGTGEQRSFLQDQIAFAYDPVAGVVSVADAVIYSELGAPMEASVKSDNATRLVFGWTLENMTNSTGQTVTWDYRAVYFKATSRFDISLKPRGYDNSFQASGTCRVE